MSDHYQVHHSIDVSNQFRHILSECRDRGDLAIAIQSARWLLSELQSTPLELGESRYASENQPARLLFRIATAGPIQVEFAVRDDVKMVFIRRFALRKF